MRWWLAIGLVLSLLMPVEVFPCDKHQIPEFGKGLMIVAPLEATGMFGFWYDTDMDGIADYALIFQRDNAGNYETWPLFYFYGVNVFGQAEEVYKDKGGEGMCHEIQLYYKRRVTQ